jgi:aspartyl-tRNA synthetase
MLAAGTNNIRDVVAFPKNNRGEDLMMNSPSSPEPRQLRELGLQVTRKP